MADYVKLEFVSSGNFKMTQGGTWTATPPTVEFSKNGGAWTTLTYGTDYPVQYGDVIEVRGSSDKAFATSTSIYIKFNPSAYFKVSGDMGTLINYQTPPNDLPAYAFVNMFQSLKTLVDCSGLYFSAKGTWNSNACYQLFSSTNCSVYPDIVAETLGNSAAMYMYNSCKGLIDPPTIYTKNLGQACLRNIFTGCSNLTNKLKPFYYFGKRKSGIGTGDGTTEFTLTGTLPFKKLFAGSVNIYYNRSTLIAVDDGEGGFIQKSLNQKVQSDSTINYTTGEYSIHIISTSAVSAGTGIDMEYDFSELHANGTNPFYSMNYGTAIESIDWEDVPIVDNISAYNYMYQSLFYYCQKLKTVSDDLFKYMKPVSNYAFYQMFYNCTALKKAPIIKNIAIVSGANRVFYAMFYGCTSLLEAPELPNIAVNDYQFYQMFRGCSSLTKCPELPFETLANYCYSQMFYDCVSLKKLPNLPAINLPTSCYASMFYNCANIKLSASQIGDYKVGWKFPSAGTSGTKGANYAQDMFTGTGGTFTGTPVADTTYYTIQEVALEKFYDSKNDLTIPVRDGTALSAETLTSQVDSLTNDVNTSVETLESNVNSFSCIKLINYYGLDDGDKIIGSTRGIFNVLSLPDKIKMPDVSSDPSIYDITGYLGVNGTFYYDKYGNRMNKYSSSDEGTFSLVLKQYLSFKALANTTIKFYQHSDSKVASTCDLRYKIDNGSEQSYTLGTNINLTAGQIIYWRNANANLCNGLETAATYSLVRFSSTGNIEAHGDLAALINWETSSVGYKFQYLFKDCTTLKTIPYFMNKQGSSTHTFLGLFMNCTGLVDCSGEFCKPYYKTSSYSDFPKMFKGCTNLKKPPIVFGHCQTSNSSTTLNTYEEMFEGCTSLEEVRLFFDRSVYEWTKQTHPFPDGDISNTLTPVFKNWMKNVKAGGKFYFNGRCSTRGDSTIPSSWTILKLA